MTTELKAKVQDFSLTLCLDSAGWFEARISLADTDYDFRVSYLSEPLHDLLETIIQIDSYYDGRYKSLGDPKFPLVWQGEPWRYAWLFEPQAHDILRVTLTYCSDDFDEHPAPEELRFVALLSFRELARQTYEQSRDILRKFGFLGYRDEWISSDFPISDLLRLHYIVTGEQPHRESLATELEYLSQLLLEGQPIGN